LVGLSGSMTFAFLGVAFAAAAAAAAVRLVGFGTGVSNQLSGFRTEKKLPKSPPKVPPLPCFSSTVINSSKSMLFERSASASLNACSSCSSLMLRPERSAWGDLMSRRNSSLDIVPLPSVSAASKRGRSFPLSAAVDMASETGRCGLTRGLTRGWALVFFRIEVLLSRTEFAKFFTKIRNRNPTVPVSCHDSFSYTSIPSFACSRNVRRRLDLT